MNTDERKEAPTYRELQGMVREVANTEIEPGAVRLGVNAWVAPEAEAELRAVAADLVDTPMPDDFPAPTYAVGREVTMIVPPRMYRARVASVRGDDVKLDRVVRLPTPDQVALERRLWELNVTIPKVERLHQLAEQCLVLDLKDPMFADGGIEAEVVSRLRDAVAGMVEERTHAIAVIGWMDQEREEVLP